MITTTRFEDLPSELKIALRNTQTVVAAYLHGLSFIVSDTARDPRYVHDHLLFYLCQSLLESAISIVALSLEGVSTVAKRELRFIIELSIKLCYVQQKNYQSTITQKLSQFEKELESQRISIKENLNLEMLNASMRDAFVEEVGRLYGLTSKFIHLSPNQITERIAAVKAGRFAGKEGPEAIAKLNDLVARVFAVSLVLIYHSVPSSVAGAWFVESDGKTVQWYFMKSQFVSAIDAYFDYKAERQDALREVIELRRANVRF